MVDGLFAERLMGRTAAITGNIKARVCRGIWGVGRRGHLSRASSVERQGSLEAASGRKRHYSFFLSCSGGGSRDQWFWGRPSK